jgi:5-methylcytosine-specific restriction endonuclease McrA
MTKRTLVLTSWYMPIQIVSWRDAITDLYLGKVESIFDYDEVVRSPSVEMQLPAVVRILRQTGGHKRGVKFSKVNVAARDKYRCQYCLARLPLSKITYDHVFPRSRGGETTWDNVVCACSTCNSKKDNKTPEEAGMTLHTVPRRPHCLPIEPLRIRDMPEVPEQWLQFATT